MRPLSSTHAHADGEIPSRRQDDPSVRSWPNLLIHDGAFAVDECQRITYWNASAERILGQSAREVVGKPCYEVLGGEDSKRFPFCRRDCPLMADARRGYPTPEYDLVCTIPTGGQKWLNVSIATSRKSRNEFEILHQFRDVGECRRRQEFARKAGSTLWLLLEERNGDSAAKVGGSSAPLPKLSRRGLEVLRYLAEGSTTAEIAEALGIRPVTARNHISRLLNTLGVGSRLQAVVYAYRDRLL